ITLLSIAIVAAIAVFVVLALRVREENRADVKTEDTAGKPGKDEGGTETNVENEEAAAASDSELGEVKLLERSSMISGDPNDYYDASIVPKVEAYSVKSDLSDIFNQRDIEYVSDEAKQKLAQDLFVVCDGGYDEFFELYEGNRYNMTPNFVTVDSMMHTYHLYFAHLLKKIEKNQLYDDVCEITEKMLDNSLAQYEKLKGSEWEEASLRNVAFFAVAGKLLGLNIDVPGEVRDVVNSEVGLVSSESMSDSPLFGGVEDYSQYKPRGYYEGDETLEKYFRGMMWYGRRGFMQSDDDQMRSALLMVEAMDDDVFKLWEGIYTVTSFFAGVSDDVTYYEFKPIVEAAYGDIGDVSSLIGNDSAYREFCAYTKKMEPPKINSIPVYEGDEILISNFRFMGQRFSIDANIFQNLVYRFVEENAAGDRRMLPDPLDIPAALGSEDAYGILKEQGDTGYKNYDTNMEKMREEMDPENNPELWNASLYSQWLYTLKPVLTKKGEGYPSFMLSNNWGKKSVEGFLGSYTELKHDTILYSKQIMAEMGDGGWDEVYDDRGYVEPEPAVFARLAVLALSTKEGLKGYRMLDEADSENLDIIFELSKKLAAIADKELSGGTVTEDEYELIRDIGGDLEHLWVDATKERDDEYLTTYEHPCPIVADIATDPNGAILEVGTGGADIAYVICPVEGTLRVCKGPVFKFYAFSSASRLTDSEWREMLGIWPGSKFDYNGDPNLKQPEWTDSYRYRYVRDFD
nr:DUF3160 domain-containing protein [Lachnospiraceae bacterium]